MGWFTFATLFLINLFGFLLMGIDKRRAKQQMWRVPERAIWTVAVFGGALGTAIGMFHFRHKTKHSAFRFGLPALGVLQMSLFFQIPVDFFTEERIGEWIESLRNISSNPVYRKGYYE